MVPRARHSSSSAAHTHEAIRMQWTDGGFLLTAIRDRVRVKIFRFYHWKKKKKSKICGEELCPSRASNCLYGPQQRSVVPERFMCCSIAQKLKTSRKKEKRHPPRSPVHFGAPKVEKQREVQSNCKPRYSSFLRSFPSLRRTVLRFLCASVLFERIFHFPLFSPGISIWPLLINKTANSAENITFSAKLHYWRMGRFCMISVNPNISLWNWLSGIYP